MPNSIPITAVETELDKLDASKSSVAMNILMLAGSVGLFAAAGYMRFSTEYLAILIVVLFIHEGGHWLGMKLFGYRDLKMFFIPFLGAAVTGKERNASGTASAIVSLCGPVPGIIIGIILGILPVAKDHPLLMQYAEVSVYINLFNLIPCFPLDGGRFVETVLFSRSYLLEIAFKILAALGLLVIAWYLSSILLMVLAFLTLLACREVYFTGSMTRKLKKLLRNEPVEPVPMQERIPNEQLERIMPDLAQGLPEASVKAKTLALRARNIWLRVCRKAPGLRATLVMLACYAVVISMGTVALFAFVLMQRKATVTQRIANDGKVTRVQGTSYKGHKTEEAQLNSEDFYDGPATTWNYNGTKRSEGSYADGYRTGTWNFYDAHGAPQAVAVYAMKAPISYSVNEGGVAIEKPRAQWPDEIAYGWTNPRVSEARMPHDIRFVLRGLARLVWIKFGSLKSRFMP